jgi:hypothetical protein
LTPYAQFSEIDPFQGSGNGGHDLASARTRSTNATNSSGCGSASGVWIWATEHQEEVERVRRAGAREQSLQQIAPLLARSCGAMKYHGAYRDRTGDPLLAKQVLSQLS